MANIKTLKDLTPGTVFDAGPIDVRVLDHMTNGTTLLIADKAVAWHPFSLEPLKTRPEEAPTPYPNDFSLSYLKDELNGPFLAAFDEAEAYARRKMAFQNEALGLDRGDEYLELLIPDVIREMALAARYDGRRATA